MKVGSYNSQAILITKRIKMGAANKPLTKEYFTENILTPLENAGFKIEIERDATSYTDYKFAKNGVVISLEYNKQSSYRVNGPHIMIGWDSRRALKNPAKVLEKIFDRYEEKYADELVQAKKKNLVLEARDTLDLVLDETMYNISGYSSNAHKVSASINVREFFHQEADYSISENINFYLRNDGTIDSLRYSLRDLTPERVEKIHALMEEIVDLWESSVL